jgi:hypothetical protein
VTSRTGSALRPPTGSGLAAPSDAAAAYSDGGAHRPPDEEPAGFRMLPVDWSLAAVAAVQLLVLLLMYASLSKPAFGTYQTIVYAEFSLGLLWFLIGMAWASRMMARDKAGRELAMRFPRAPFLLLAVYYVYLYPRRCQKVRATLVLGLIWFFGSWPGLMLAHPPKWLKERLPARPAVAGASMPATTDAGDDGARHHH